MNSYAIELQFNRL